MQQQHLPVFTVTPRGLMMNGAPLNKSTSRNLPPQMLHEIANIEALLKKVKKEEWDNPTPYAGGEYPALAKASMRAALLSPQPWPPFQKQSWQELAKDASDDSDDEDDDSGDDSSDGSDDNTDGGGYSGGGHYNPDEPRIPAGQPGGGQWTTAGNGTSTDSGSLSADDVRNAPSDTITQVGSITPMAYTTTQAIPADGDEQTQINEIRSGIKVDNGQTFTPVSNNADASGNYLNQVNIFVGGALDQSYGHIVQTSEALNSSYGSNYYFNNAQQPDIDAFINNLPPDTTINLIGHSWGGDTAARVALDNPDTIDNLITVDPVTTFHIFNPDFNAVENSVDNWINIYAKPQDGTQSMGDFWANIRQGRWGTAPDGIANTFIQANQHHEGFDNMLNTQKNGVTPRQVINSSSQD